MIVHLRNKVCLKIKAPEKDDFKRIGYQKPWDVTQNISAYFKYLNESQDRLDTHHQKSKNNGGDGAYVSK